MKQTKEELETEQVFRISWGLAHVLVCAPTKMSVKFMETIVNANWPTGIDSPWTVAPTEGSTRQCGVRPDTRTHYVLVC